MNKVLLFLFTLFSLIFFGSKRDAQASLIAVKNSGEVVVKVLSSQDEIVLGIPKTEFLEVKEVAETNTSPDSRISLVKKEEKFVLRVESDTGESSLDVTNWGESVVEIEERGAVKRIQIGVVDGKFSIEQNGVIALTEFPITINPRENELSVTTSSGSIFLSVLPVEAAESALRSRFISKLEKKIFLAEEEMGVLAYTIKGEKVIDFFRLFDYKIPVTAYVSASTGEILLVDGPEWFKIFGFLFA